MEQGHWYAVQTKSRHEKVVSQYLRATGVEEFLPLYRARRRWSDRVKVVEMPLFCSYLFCRCDGPGLGLVMNAPGVIHVLGYGAKPAPIPDLEITAIRRLLESQLPATPCP